MGLLKLLQITLGLACRIREPGRSKARAEIADQIHAPAVLLLIYGIVDVLEVPVIDHGHQRTQAVELPGAQERIVLPFPFANLFGAVVLAFEPDAVHRTVGINPLAPSMYFGGDTFDFCLRLVVILVREISRSPDDARRRAFGLSFAPEFHLPFDVIAIHDGEFRTGRSEIFLDEAEGAMGDVLAAADTIEQISQPDIVRRTP